MQENTKSKKKASEATINRAALEQVRRVLIMLLNALDDCLGYPRTIPPKDERHVRQREAGPA